MDKKTFGSVLGVERNEITEYHIYSKLAEKTKDEHNKGILDKIAKDELKHYNFWKSVTKKEVKPNWFMIYFYVFISRFFGLSFGLKLMEKGEKLAIDVYNKLAKKVKGTAAIIEDEQRHEEELLDMLSEERVEYAGSIVLGLNDALVELTGALAGLTLALQNTKIIAVIGLITGIAASMSMAASEYLSSKEQREERKKATKSALYTGIAYIVTVSLLILPYLILKNIYVALAIMLTVSILIIAGYTFYISTAKNLKFWHRFLEMALISLTVAVISFGVGWLLRLLFNI